jgi:hypothetical protein
MGISDISIYGTLNLDFYSATNNKLGFNNILQCKLYMNNIHVSGYTNIIGNKINGLLTSAYTQLELQNCIFDMDVNLDSCYITIVGCRFLIDLRYLNTYTNIFKYVCLYTAVGSIHNVKFS